MMVPPEEIMHFVRWRDNDVYIKDGYTPTEEELKIFNEYRKDFLKFVFVEC